MSAVLERCALAGIRLWMEGPALRYDAPKGAMTEELAADIKAHKPDIVKALGQPPAPKRRGLGGYGTPPGVPPLGDCALARHIAAMPEGDHVPSAETPIAGLPKPRAPVNLEEVLAAACEVLAGITPEVFRSLLSDEDVADIAAGDIPPRTLGAYARSFAEGIRERRIAVPGGEP